MNIPDITLFAVGALEITMPLPIAITLAIIALRATGQRPAMSSLKLDVTARRPVE